MLTLSPRMASGAGRSGPAAALLLALLLPLSATGCLPAGEEAHAAGPLPEASAGRGPFSRDLLLTGELEAVRSVAINSPATSIFQMRIQYMAEEGSAVQEGDPLLDFDNAAVADRVLDLESQILDAEVQIVARRNEMESRLKDLEIQLAEHRYAYDVAKLEAEIDPEILSRREYGERRLAFETAARNLAETRARVEATRAGGRADLDVLTIARDKLRQDLASAHQDLSLLSIRAPAAGLVIYETRPRSTTRWQEGDSCWPGQTIIRLPDLSAMQVVFAVSEVDARLLHPGMPVEIRMDSFPDRRLSGEIRRIPSMAVGRDEESRVKVFEVVASLSETWPERMKPGMSVRGQVVVEQRDDAFQVPRSWVAWQDGVAWLRRPGDSPGERIQVHPVSRNAEVYVLDEERDGEALARLGLVGDGSAS